MLPLHGAHDDDDHAHARPREATGTWSKAPDFASDPERAAAVREATARDRERYLNAGLAPVDCRFCHVTVAVKKLGPEHTAVQWSSEATQRCATFAEVRASGGDSSRSQVVPEAGRQHQARRRRGLPGGDVAAPRRPATADRYSPLKRSLTCSSVSP